MFFWILIGYLSLLIILARVFSKKIDGLNEFFLASRNLPAWVATATFVASWIGAASTIGTIDKAFSQGLSAFWYMAIPSALSLYMITFVFARRVNRIQALSMPQAFEGRYGATAGFFLSSVILFASVTLLASQLVAAGQLIHTAADIPVEWATWLTLAVIVIYSVIGGFRAVVMTDVFQVALLGLGLFILFAFSMWVGWPHMEAGVNAMIAGAVASAATHVPAEVAHEALVDPTQFWNPFVELPKHLMITATFILGWCIAPEMWQRMQAVANPDDALKVGLGSIASTMLLFLAIVFTGISAVGALHH
ncbi:MAG: hypothetical protein KC475_06250, partial [Cyanobacteria bacterium HKST-UBA03]|nr:hypothetical protein [Cyanobacteria bacterium HKST-UBA03]